MHEAIYRRYLSGASKQYCSSFEILKHGDYKMIELETVFGSKRDAMLRETYHMMEHKKAVNLRRSGVPPEVVAAEMRAYQKEYSSAYYEVNQEAVRKRLKDRYASNKEVCGCGGKTNKIAIFRAGHEASKKHQTWLKTQTRVDANTQREVPTETRTLDEFITVSVGNQPTVQSADGGVAGSV